MSTPSAAPHALDAAALADRQGVDPDRGLTAAEVRRRRGQFGINQLRRAEGKSALVILAHQFKSVIVWLLAAGAAFSLWLGDLSEALAIAVVLLINGAIGFATELRAERSIEALRKIAQVRTRVRRDGAGTTVDARDLVPGDVVLLRAGDIVTADLRLIDGSNLQMDESVLTGESVPIDKSTGPLADDTALGDRVNMAFKGTAVTRGEGTGIIAATGMDTELGQISDLAQSAHGEVSPLERRLDRLGHRLVWLTLALALLTVLAGVLRDRTLAEMVQMGVALAVAAVPEGLPVVATLSLARGMWRMAARNAVISNMPSVETLGATTLILTDKTGTLTENRMTAVRYLLDGADVDRDPATGGLRAGDAAAQLDQALRIGVLCNDATLGGADGTDSGDPMEVALLAAAQRRGAGREALLKDMPKVATHPFDPDLKMMATVHAAGDGGYLFAVKGAPEAVLARCTRLLGPTGDKPMDAATRAQWTRRSQDAASEGLRLLALAMKHGDDPQADPFDALQLVAMVCLLDPLRADVPDAIAAARAAGVRVIMMTGDHAATAATIAGKAGLGNGAVRVMEDCDLDAGTADDPDLRDKVLATDVFARVSPQTKLDLARLFQQSGEIVAMTGDGVNDAPALKKADIGIAMGQRGTEVAREAAEMVLKDDAFATIVAAMRQGRIIFENIRTFVIYLMSCNVSEVLVVGLAVGLGLPAPLLPLQILFLNLVTDIFPAFALGLGQGDDAIMSRPPRDPSEQIVNGDQWILIGVLGALITAATLGAFGLSIYWLGLDAGPSVTVAFLTLALAQLWNVFNVRKRDSALLVNEISRNPWVWAALGLCLVLLATALWHPGLSGLLQLEYPGARGMGLALGASLAFLMAAQFSRALVPSGRATAARPGAR